MMMFVDVLFHDDLAASFDWAMHLASLKNIITFLTAIFLVREVRRLLQCLLAIWTGNILTVVNLPVMFVELPLFWEGLSTLLAPKLRIFLCRMISHFMLSYLVDWHRLVANIATSYNGIVQMCFNVCEARSSRLALECSVTGAQETAPFTFQLIRQVFLQSCLVLEALATI